MAIADKWLGNADSEEHWRDSMVRVTGPPAAAIQSAFAAPWAHSAGEILVGDAFYPTLTDGAPGSIRHVGVGSAPTSDHHPLRLYFMQTFLAARRTLYIATPYFVPDGVLREAVARKARSGVDVRILLPDEHTDALPIRYTTHSYMGELLAAGVKMYEYQPTMMHSKEVDGGRPLRGGRLRQHGHPLEGAERGERARHPRPRARGADGGGVPPRPRAARRRSRSRSGTAAAS